MRGARAKRRLAQPPAHNRPSVRGAPPPRPPTPHPSPPPRSPRIRSNMPPGLDLPHVPYRGGTPAMAALIAGRIDYQCATTSALPHIESGTVKPIAIFAKERSPILPQVATAQEQGLEEFEADEWFGIFLPKGAPAEIVRKLHAACIARMDLPPVH